MVRDRYTPTLWGSLPGWHLASVSAPIHQLLGALAAKGGLLPPEVAPDSWHLNVVSVMTAAPCAKQHCLDVCGHSILNPNFEGFVICRRRHAGAAAGLLALRGQLDADPGLPPQIGLQVSQHAFKVLQVCDERHQDEEQYYWCRNSMDMTPGVWRRAMKALID